MHYAFRLFPSVIFVLSLRLNRVAFTLESPCLYAYIVSPFKRKGDAIWLKWQREYGKARLLGALGGVATSL